VTSEVDFILDQLAPVASAQPADHPLYRVDRDNALTYESDAVVANASPTRSRSVELADANVVSVSYQEQANTAIGTEFDYKIERVCSVRIEGVHESEFGHIDKAGSNGVAFETLVNDIRDAILAERTFPDAGERGRDYTELLTANEARVSSERTDEFRHDFDVVFGGFETL
jgi:hypothetical protein